MLNDYQIFLENFPELSAEPVVPASVWRSTIVEEVDMHNYEHIANAQGSGKFEVTSNRSVNRISRKILVIICIYGDDDNSRFMRLLMARIARIIKDIRWCQGRKEFLLPDIDMGVPVLIGNYNSFQFGSLFWSEIVAELGLNFDETDFMNLLYETNFL